MAAYLLLHGAWHGAWCWDPLVARLTNAGHQVVAPDLPGLTPGTADVAGKFGLGDHIDAAVDALDRIQCESVILVAHSYAGILARAVEGLRPERLEHVCSIEAIHPAPGEAVLDVIPDKGTEFLASVCDTSNGPVLLPPDVSRFAVPDAAIARNIAARLLPQPFRTFTEPLPPPVAKAPRDIDRTYVFAGDRNPNPYQKLINHLRSEATCRIIAMTGGHELMLTRPGDLAELLLEIAVPGTARTTPLTHN